MKTETAKPKICLWQEQNKWYWDDAEDHGGFDRCKPAGPFDTEVKAIKDASALFGAESMLVAYQKPEHYPPENENVLEGMKCPKCGMSERLDIVVTVWAHMTDEGSECLGDDMGFEDESACRCPECYHVATVAEFKGLPKPETDFRFFTVRECTQDGDAYLYEDAAKTAEEAQEFVRSIVLRDAEDYEFEGDVPALEFVDFISAGGQWRTTCPVTNDTYRIFKRKI